MILTFLELADMTGAVSTPRRFEAPDGVTAADIAAALDGQYGAPMVGRRKGRHAA